MRIKQIAILTGMIALLLFSFAPSIPEQYRPSDSIMRITNNQSIPADGEIVELQVPILEEETVSKNNPDSNLHGNTFKGGLFVGEGDQVDETNRAWFKFDLSNLPKEIAHVHSATIKVYLNDEFTVADMPFGMYYSPTDSWAETTITWNNQPGFDTTPSDVIDSPMSPDMFVLGNWYEWDVSSYVQSTLNTNSDQLMSFVLKLVTEETYLDTFKYFNEKEFSYLNASYLSVQYTTPTTTGLTVDGHSSTPLTDYIQNSEPTFGWMMDDSDIGESQRDFEMEFWNNEYFNDSQLMSTSHNSLYTITADATTNSRPLGISDEMRYQFKYPSTMLGKSGTVDKIHFTVIDPDGVASFENLIIVFANTDVVGDLTADFEANFGQAQRVTVLSRDVYDAVAENGVLTIDVENLFQLNDRTDFIIEMRFTDNTGDHFSSRVEIGIGGSIAYAYGDGEYYSTTATFTFDRVQQLAIEFASEEVYNGGVSSNAYPFGTDPGFPGTVQFKYNSSMIGQTGIIDRIYFPVNQFATDVVFDDLQVYLLETPVLGRLSDTFTDNYGGLTPTLVLDKETYTFHNVGNLLILDIDNIFEYTGEHDLLFEMTWFEKISGTGSVYRTLDAGGYRAFDVTYLAFNGFGNDTRTVDMFMDFIHPENEVMYQGTTDLVNETEYYWRVRTRDSAGVWSSWESQSFKFEPLTSTPDWAGLSFSPSPGIVGNEVTATINVTYFLGVGSVWIELAGMNYSMAGMDDMYSYSWTPTEAADLSYTVYMESLIDTWSSTSGVFSIVAPSSLPILSILIVGGVALVVIVVLMKRR